MKRPELTGILFAVFVVWSAASMLLGVPALVFLTFREHPFIEIYAGISTLALIALLAYGITENSKRLLWRYFKRALLFVDRWRR